MLRGSINISGEHFDMAALNGAAIDGDIPYEEALMALTDAICRRERAVCDRLRADLQSVLGVRAVADACAVIAAFQGFNRIADSVGTPVDPAQQNALTPIRGAIGLDTFYRATHA